jgi:acyl-coenzyme A synthetase/AMP-(fatty) acid ligase
MARTVISAHSAVEFVEEIPKAPSGKILRRVLSQRDHQASGQSD